MFIYIKKKNIFFKMSYKKQRWFIATNWNLNTEEVFNKNKKQIRYIMFGEEICPETKTKHHQAFIYFINNRSTGNRSLNAIAEMFKLKKKDKHIYVNPMRGNFMQNEAYVSKEGIYKKLGEEPKPGLRTDLKETADEILKGNLSVDEIVAECPSMYHQYGRTLEKLEILRLRKQWRTEMTEGIWLWGPTGVGKSHEAFRNYHPDTHFIKDLNVDWWDGYKGQPIIIFNEFRGQIKLGELLDLIDKYPKNVPVRGRESVPFLAKKIIITSCKAPDEVYKNCGENLEQLYRRIEVKHLEKRIIT